jgi:hypothetical protein
MTREGTVPRRALAILLLLFVVGIPCATAAADGFVCDGGDLEQASRVTLDADPPPHGGTITLAAEPTPGGSLLSQTAAPALAAQAPLTPRAKAFEYSDGYFVRAKIHRYASFATLPLFIAQFAVGQKLYNSPGSGSGSWRSAHIALGAGTGLLFAVNATTGAWNAWEARKDPNRKTRRTLHGVLMVVAEAGLATSGLLAPEHETEGGVSRWDGNRSTHRTIALSAMGVATASYLIMLFGH